MSNLTQEILLDEFLNKCSSEIRQSFFSTRAERANLIFRISYMLKPSATLVDLGGGLSPVNAVLSRMGMNVTVYDYFSMYWADRHYSSNEVKILMEQLQMSGVKLIDRNLEHLNLEEIHGSNSVDIVASHHCLEHFHNSPKELLESAIRSLKPGGRLILEVPNAANIRKRINLLFGKTNYGSYNDFFYSKAYFGHVREYTIGDLKILSSNINQNHFKIFGTNFLGLEKVPAPLRKSVDHILRLCPGLCASIYLDLTKS